MSSGEWAIVMTVAALLIVLFVGLEVLFPAPKRPVTKAPCDPADDPRAASGARRVA